MAVTGKNAEFKWVSTTYDADDCLQNWNLDRNVEDITYYCNGHTKHLAGNANAVFSCSLALSATDTAKIAALEEGTTGAWIGYPAGNTATYMKFTATRGVVINAPVSAPQNGVVTVDVTIALDDCTDAAVT